MATRQIDELAKGTVILLVYLIGVGIIILLFSQTLRLWFCTVSTLLVLYYICRFVANEYLIPWKLTKKISNYKKAVLITGCDTGFGNLLASRLDKMGFHVFAGCLNPSENGALELVSKSSQKLKVFELDVSDAISVQKAKKFVEDNIEDLDLVALVNNAGIYRDTMYEIMSTKNIEMELSINLLGVMRMTKAFLPLIRKCEGARIVNVASAAGRCSVPCMATYCASKYGVIAFSEVLRMELRKFGIAVVTIEPFLYRTRLCNVESVQQYAESSYNSASSDLQSTYSNFNSRIQRKLKKLPSFTNGNLDEVIDVMTTAVTSQVPKYSYCPGKLYQRLLMWASVTLLPPSIRDICYTEIIL